MNWTTEAPTVTGWYWVRYGPDTNFFAVVRVGHGLVDGQLVRDLIALKVGYSQDFPLSKFAEWYGPLEPPEPPT
jgi:hypothetical protein